MPTYEYECTKCGLLTEEFKSMNAPKRQRCPKCRGKVQRLISGGSGIHFKGSGFYITDSKGKMGSGESSGKPAPSSTGKADKKSD